MRRRPLGVRVRGAHLPPAARPLPPPAGRRPRGLPPGAHFGHLEVLHVQYCYVAIQRRVGTDTGLFGATSTWDHSVILL